MKPTNNKPEDYTPNFMQGLEDNEIAKDILKRVEDMQEPRYNYQDLNEQNEEDLIKWVVEKGFMALIDEKKGGIVGYIHHLNIDELTGELNDANKLKQEIDELRGMVKDLVQYLEWREDFTIEDADNGETNCYTKATELLNRIK